MNQIERKLIALTKMKYKFYNRKLIYNQLKEKE